MAPDAMDAFWISLIFISAWIIMAPILCWVLPDRSHTDLSVDNKN